MKIRILDNNYFGGYYTDEFLMNNINELVNGSFVKDWRLTDVFPNENLFVPKFEGDIWVEGATEDEILKIKANIKYFERAGYSSNQVVPMKVTAIQFLSALAFAGISENQIIQVIQSLPEPSKTIALIAFKRATIFERDNEFIAMLQGYFNLSNTDVDNLFINANNIII